MTHHRAARFLLEPTRPNRDAQLSRESKLRAAKFSLRNATSHHRYAQLAEGWALHILTTPNPFKESK
jgi:hypothetical protein